MGYFVHIRRPENPADEDSRSNITLEEWQAYAATDDELNMINGYYIDWPSGWVASPADELQNWIEDPGLCEWLAHPESDTGTIPILSYGHGEIYIKYPDDHTILKMVAIANALNAMVMGDEGEIYETREQATDFTFVNDTIIDTTVSEEAVLIGASAAFVQKKKPWWRFW
jgi:hypothetical protein